MNQKRVKYLAIILAIIFINGINAQINDELGALQNLFNKVEVKNEYAEERNQIINGLILENNSLVKINNNNVVELNLGNKITQGEIDESICKFQSLIKLNLSNNNLKGNRKNFGQLPSCIQDLKNLKEFYINGNEFRGRMPFINSTLTVCNIEGLDLCLFDGDRIPKICLGKDVIGKNTVDLGNFSASNKIRISSCKNIFVSSDDKHLSQIIENHTPNIDIKVVIWSAIFPVASMIITCLVTLYGRVKSKFNKKDNITTFSASISHLPNNFGNVSNTNNRQSLLTRFDSYNRPAPRPDNESSSLFNSKSNSLSTLDQKRISSNPSNPSTSLANTSVSSNTPSSPVISPNEIKNSNYRVIGSHYSLNQSQGIRFKNALSSMQSNRNSINTTTTEVDSIPTPITTAISTSQEVMSSVTNSNELISPIVSQSENQNRIISPITSPSSLKNSGSTTPSKAKESLDLLLSSPQALYYTKEMHSPSLSSKQGLLNKSPKPLSPIQPPKSFSSIPSQSPSLNLYSHSPINLNKSPVLMNSSSMGGYTSTKIPTSPAISVPQYMSSQHMISPQNIKIPSPNIFKSNPLSNNRLSPNPTKKPRVRRVVHSFIADLPDELQLTPGQEVIIHKVFDDGYAYGENAHNGKSGVFPITSLHPDDRYISPEEIESSPSLNDIQLSQLNMNKSPNMLNPGINKPNSPSKFNNIRLQDLTPSLVVNKSNNYGYSSDSSGRLNMSNLYPSNSNSQNSSSQNSNSQNSNSQNSLTDEDDIDSLRRQSKIGYSAFMDQQKQKLMRKQARQARKNKKNSMNSMHSPNNGQEFYHEPPFSPTYLSQNMILNENINNRMFGDMYQSSSQTINDMPSPSSVSPSPYSSRYKNMTNILNSMKSESPSALEMQRMEDRRYKQIKLLNERLSKKDIGPEEKRYYLQLLQQLTN